VHLCAGTWSEETCEVRISSRATEVGCTSFPGSYSSSRTTSRDVMSGGHQSFVRRTKLHKLLNDEQIIYILKRLRAFVPPSHMLWCTKRACLIASHMEPTLHWDMSKCKLNVVHCTAISHAEYCLMCLKEYLKIWGYKWRKKWCPSIKHFQIRVRIKLGETG
jgi:hypothetical protein